MEQEQQDDDWDWNSEQPQQDAFTPFVTSPI
jgi:hypothetical protein